MNRKLMLLSVLVSVSLSPIAMASQLAACQQDNGSLTCQSYLEGIVDGALMYKPNAVGARLETNGYESRALKYRGGKRFQEANRIYCAERIPDRDVLVSGIAEAIALGSVDDLNSLQDVVTNLLDCQRLK